MCQCQTGRSGNLTFEMLGARIWKFRFSLPIIIVLLNVVLAFGAAGIGGAQNEQTSVPSPPTRKSMITGYVAEWEYHEDDEAPSTSTTSYHYYHPHNDGPQFDDPTTTATTTTNEKLSQRKSYPSNRINPAFWQDSTAGSWWLFGGEGRESRNNQQNFLSDLWLYEKSSLAPPEQHHHPSTKLNWKPIFQPENNNSPNDDGDGDESAFSPSSSFPEFIQSPILCGSMKEGNLAVFANSNSKSEFSSDGGGGSLEEPFFMDDNLIWIYKIPETAKSDENQKPSSYRRKSSSGESPWTSYMCCDLCDSPSTESPTSSTASSKNSSTSTNLEFCPHFFSSKGKGTPVEIEPILWCSQDSLMALQLTFSSSFSPESSYGKSTPTSTSTTTTSTKINLISSRSNNSAASIIEEELINEFPTTPIIKSQRAFKDPTKIGSLLLHSPPKISSKDKNKYLKMKEKAEVDGKDVKDEDGEEDEFLESFQKENVEKKKYLNWWKFNLVSTEWEKLPPVVINSTILRDDDDGIQQLFNKKRSSSSCRSTSDSVYVYIFCLPKVMEKAGGEKQGEHESPSTGTRAVRNIFLFNPATSSIDYLPTPLLLNNGFEEDLELWKPTHSVLHALRMPKSNQTILLLAYHKLIDFWIHDHSTGRVYPVENVWKGVTLDKFQHHDSFYKLKIRLNNSSAEDEHEVFLPNPRNSSRLIFNEEESASGRWFHINIESDENIFLPSRDTSFMINVEEDEEDEEVSTIMAKARPPSLLDKYDSRSPSKTKSNNSSTTTKIEESQGKELKEDDLPLAFNSSTTFFKVGEVVEQKFPNDKKTSETQFNSNLQTTTTNTIGMVVAEVAEEESKLLKLKYETSSSTRGKADSSVDDDGSTRTHVVVVIGKLNNTSTNTTSNSTSPTSSTQHFSSPSSSNSDYSTNGKVGMPSTSTTTTTSSGIPDSLIETNVNPNPTTSRKLSNNKNSNSNNNNVLFPHPFPSLIQKQGVNHQGETKKSAATPAPAPPARALTYSIFNKGSQINNSVMKTNDLSYQQLQHHQGESTAAVQFVTNVEEPQPAELKSDKLYASPVLWVSSNSGFASTDGSTIIKEINGESSNISPTTTTDTTTTNRININEEKEKKKTSEIRFNGEDEIRILKGPNLITDYSNHAMSNNNNDADFVESSPFRSNNTNNNEESPEEDNSDAAANNKFSSSGRNGDDDDDGSSSWSSSSDLDSSESGDYSYSNSIIFFGISFLIFITIGIVLFVRRCVKCPTSPQKDGDGIDVFTDPIKIVNPPPSLHYSGLASTPDDFYLNTAPIV